MLYDYLNLWANRLIGATVVGVTGYLAYTQMPNLFENPTTLGVVAVLGVLAAALAMQHQDLV